MNDESFGTVVVRAASRNGKDCAFKREMIARLSRDYDLDGKFMLHTGIFIAARLSANVTYTHEYWAWEKYRKAAVSVDAQQHPAIRIDGNRKRPAEMRQTTTIPETGHTIWRKRRTSMQPGTKAPHGPAATTAKCTPYIRRHLAETAR